LSQDYRVAVEKRVYLTQGEETILIGIPDVSVTATPQASTGTATAIATEPTIVEIPLAEEVQERYLEIREIATGRVVTVIELLSPKNKRSGDGRDAYSQKRQRIMLSQKHWTYNRCCIKSTIVPVSPSRSIIKNHLPQNFRRTIGLG
jgi:hypothetical protein